MKRKNIMEFTLLFNLIILLLYIRHEQNLPLLVQAARKGGGKKGGGSNKAGGKSIPQTQESIKILQKMHLYDYNYNKNGDDWPYEFSTCQLGDQSPIELLSKFRD